MKTVKLCTGLSLSYKADGIWLNFETANGQYVAVNLQEYFTATITKSILVWADERLQEETDGN